MKKVPKHLGIIIDGNRRWAKSRGVPAFFGHKKGFDRVSEIGEYSLEKGIKILTLYCFSTENWQRSEKEVKYLMNLLADAFSDENINKINKRGVAIKVIGQKEKLKKSLQEKIEKAEELTKKNEKGVLNLAISYGGRSEIIEAVKKVFEKKLAITEKNISDNIWTAKLPDPDLIIRTGGERRLSNFLTWQSVYSELFFCDKPWPAFTKKDLDNVLEDYSKRERRFGK